MTPAPSSVRWVGNALVRAAFSRAYRTFVRTQPADLLTHAGVAPLPTLSPATRRVGPHLWIIPVQLDAIAVPMAGAIVAHHDLPTLVEWLRAQTGLTGLELGMLPGARVGLELAADRLIDSVVGDDLRVHADPRAPEFRYLVGTLVGHPILIGAGPHLVTLATDPAPAARAAVEAQLRLRGWIAGTARWQL